MLQTRARQKEGKETHLVHALHDIIAGARDLDGGILGIRVLLDLVALLGRDLGLALFNDFGYGTAGTATRPLPGDCFPFPISNRIRYATVESD